MPSAEKTREGMARSHGSLTCALTTSSGSRYSVACQKELHNGNYPLRPDILSEHIGVSFPQPIGYRRYDLERTKDREKIGKVFSTDLVKSDETTVNFVTAFFTGFPLSIRTTGRFATPDRVEVNLGDKPLGCVEREMNENYFVSSTKGNATITVSSDLALVRTTGSTRRFTLQIDRNCLPGVSRPNPDSTIVYDPAITSTDPLVVMGFLLALRMIYQPFDF